ncbi:L-2-amino-thiazoline-4-carboxylic acid hydrolase [Candidatus Bipolaricaulota bacterium]
MTEIRTWTRQRDGEVSYNCGEDFPRLTRLPVAFHEFLENQVPEIAAEHSARFERMLRDLLSEAGAEPANIQSSVESWSDLSSLQRLLLEYACSLLRIRAASSDDELSVPRERFWRANLYPVYYMFKAALEMMERESALELLKQFVDVRRKALTDPIPDLPDPGRWWDELEAPCEVTEGVAARFGQGKIAFRVESCILHDVMTPLGDPELADIVCCYGDKSGFEALNPNLVFTRTTTLMDGPYCDACMHDRRFVDTIDHPDHEFFQQLSHES